MVTLELTEMEAGALWQLVSNSADEGLDVFFSGQPDWQEAAENAVRKLTDARRSAT